MMGYRKQTLILDNGELTQISNCIGIAAKQLMKENFEVGKPISDQFIHEVLKIQEKIEGAIK